MPWSLAFFPVAQELVAFDRRYHSNATFFAVFGALNAAQAAYAHRSGKGDLVWKRQKDLHRRTFLHVFSQEKIDPAGADVPRFGCGFSNSCPCGPTNNERQPHGKTLSSSAFRAGQGGSSLIEGTVYLGATQGTIGLKTQIRSGSAKYECTRTLPVVMPCGAWL